LALPLLNQVWPGANISFTAAGVPVGFSFRQDYLAGGNSFFATRDLDLQATLAVFSSEMQTSEFLGLR
jgi:hypothetical protein